MKTAILSSLILFAIAAGAAADADKAPYINSQLKKLETKVQNDLADGALTKPDGDELTREIGEVRSVETSEPSLTRATRRDLREKVAKIQKDLERKEGQAKALAGASASPTP
jgi:hypothetical protein